MIPPLLRIGDIPIKIKLNYRGLIGFKADPAKGRVRINI
jgi:hypothetical protein